MTSEHAPVVRSCGRTRCRRRAASVCSSSWTRAAGGVVFTTIQKFAEAHGVLSERANVMVMADEAHRSQYGFVEGGARWMREALPNATFVGFTGTPLERDDKNTVHVLRQWARVRTGSSRSPRAWSLCWRPSSPTGGS